MIKYLMSNIENGRITLGMVISSENVDKLKEGYAIHFSAEEMDLPKLDINEIEISFCETEEKAYELMKESGFISDETEIVEKKISRQ